MPPVLAYAALAVVVGAVWRWSKGRAAAPRRREEADRFPGELFDAEPLVRGDDGIYRPRRRS
jgi:hypothetical protein